MLEVEVRLGYRTVREAEAVVRAVSPDNIKVPLGLYVRSVRRGRRVFARVRCETGLRTFVSTVDDLLSAVCVAERVVCAVECC